MNTLELLELKQTLATKNIGINGILLNKAGYDELYKESQQKPKVDRLVFDLEGFTIIRNDIP